MAYTIYDATRQDHLKIVVSAAVLSTVFTIVGIAVGPKPLEPIKAPVVKDSIEIKAPPKAPYGIAVAMSNETRNAIA